MAIRFFLSQLFLSLSLVVLFILPSSVAATEIKQIYLQDDEGVVKLKKPVVNAKDVEAIKYGWVTVEGRSGLNSGHSIARRSAMISAYRQAIKPTNKETKNKYSQWDNLQSIVKILTNNSNSYVRQYQLLDGRVDSNDEQSYVVKLKAYVVREFEDKQEQYDNISDFLRLIGTPRILFLLARDPDANLAVANYEVTENLIANNLKKVGYDVLTYKSIKNQFAREDLDKARLGDSYYTSNIARHLNVDLVITGKFNLNSTVGMTKDWKCCYLFTFNWKVLIPGSNKKVNYVVEEKYRSSGGKEKREQSKGLAHTINVVSQKLKTEILSVVSRETYDITVVIRNSTSENADNIKNRLASLEGVKDVIMGNWHKSGTLFTVKSIYTGPRGQEIGEALIKKFAGLNATSIEYDNIEMYY